MRNVCIFLLMVCSLYACEEGCGNKEVNADLTISFPPSVNTPILEYIDTVKYLKLEDKDEALLAYVNKMVCREDKIYLGDFSNHKIVVYDTIGRFQYVIDRQGRGSGEYLQIKSFAVDDSCLYVLDTFLPGLHVFDNRTGAYVAKKRMAFIAWDFETLSRGRMIFTFCFFKDGHLPPSQPSYRLLITDNDLNIIQRLLPFEEEGDPIGKEVYFTSNDREVVFNWCMNDSFVILDKANPDSLRRIRIDFGVNQIPESYRGDYDLIIGGSCNYIYETPVVDGDYIAMEVRKKDLDECYLFHVPSGRLLANPSEVSSPYMAFPDCCDTQGHFIEAIVNKEFYDEHVESGFPRADAEFEKHLEDGMALLIYKMKK